MLGFQDFPQKNDNHLSLHFQALYYILKRPNFQETFRSRDLTFKRPFIPYSYIMTTTEIVNKFVEAIDTDLEYTLPELIQFLTVAYGNDVKPKKTKAIKTDKEPKIKKSKTADPEKVKRAPSAYNNFIKQKIIELKTEQPLTPAKELMGIAAKQWKDLSDEDKAIYKN